ELAMVLAMQDAQIVAAFLAAAEHGDRPTQRTQGIHQLPVGAAHIQCAPGRAAAQRADQSILLDPKKVASRRPGKASRVSGRRGLDIGMLHLMCLQASGACQQSTYPGGPRGYVRNASATSTSH